MKTSSWAWRNGSYETRGDCRRRRRIQMVRNAKTRRRRRRRRRAPGGDPRGETPREAWRSSDRFEDKSFQPHTRTTQSKGEPLCGNFVRVANLSCFAAIVLEHYLPPGAQKTRRSTKLIISQRAHLFVLHDKVRFGRVH